jgi:hypothetical protein
VAHAIDAGGNRRRELNLDASRGYRPEPRWGDGRRRALYTLFPALPAARLVVVFPDDLLTVEDIGAGEGIRTPDPNLGKVLLGLTGAIRAHPTPLHTSGFLCVS